MQRTQQSTPFRDAYSVKPRVHTQIKGESRTVQSFKNECDINTILGRYLATGELPNINELPPQYLDVSEMDFQAHQNVIADAMSLFNSLPSNIRTRFENDAGKFMGFIHDPKNRQELTEMGLARPIASPSIPAAQLNLSTAQNAAKPAEDVTEAKS